jgi:hypothetical protein
MNNHQNIYRIEHKTHRNIYLREKYPHLPINSGFYTYFMEYNPFQGSFEFKENQDALLDADMKALYLRLSEMDGQYDNPREMELRRGIADRKVPGLGAPAAWNFKRPNAYCDPYLREIYYNLGKKQKRLPLYGFRDKENIHTWFDTHPTLLEDFLKSGQFELVKYRAFEVYHGLRQSIFYPRFTDERTIVSGFLTNEVSSTNSNTPTSY